MQLPSTNWAYGHFIYAQNCWVVHTPQIIFVERAILFLGTRTYHSKRTMMTKMFRKFYTEKCNIYPTVLVTSVLVASLLFYQDLLVLHQSTIYSNFCSFSPLQPTTTKLTSKGPHTLPHGVPHVCFTQKESRPSPWPAVESMTHFTEWHTSRMYTHTVLDSAEASSCYTFV